jgi:uncharacterized protein (TIGR02145 family)
LQAQSGITVQPISANYGNKTVTFSVSWLNSSRTGTHNAKVWIWVDFAPVTGNVVTGSWSRALVSGTPTASSGTPTRETSNDKGFWLQGTSGSSGTYNATVMVQLSNVPAKFNWCAYVSDYPPNMKQVNGNFIFKGTPPFTLKPTSGTATLTVTETTLSATSFTFVPAILTDATDCPGIINWYGCNVKPLNLGTVGFTSAQTWVVGSQTWSAPVTATYCAKTTYSGGTNPFNADCRNNPDSSYPPLFSWCMIVQFGDQLCPSPWRVPTFDENCTLNKVLLSTATCNNVNTGFQSFYTGTTFGAVLPGMVRPNNTYGEQGDSWYGANKDEIDDDNTSVHMSYISQTYAKHVITKGFGFSLRCIK